MKNIQLTIWVLSLLVMTMPTAFAQNKLPQRSQPQTIKQEVGLTTFTLHYSRPTKKGRNIFGELVPYDAIWRTGANENTTLEFNTSITVNGKKVEAGTYAVYTKPGKKSWEIYLYKDTKNWGVPKEWEEAKIVASKVVNAIPISDPISTFTISFDDITNNSAVLGLMWDNVYVGMQFEVPTKEKVKKNIETLTKGPSVWDYLGFAQYYMDNEDYKQAKVWIDKSASKAKSDDTFENTWYVLYYQAVINKELGLPATSIAKEALKGAKEKENVGMIKTIERFLEKK